MSNTVEYYFYCPDCGYETYVEAQDEDQAYRSAMSAHDSSYEQATGGMHCGGDRPLVKGPRGENTKYRWR